MTTETGHPAALDLARYIQPGDLVAWGQGCAEPLTLTEALADQRKQLGGVRCFTGISSPAAVRPEHCDYLSFSSYTAACASCAAGTGGTCWRPCASAAARAWPRSSRPPEEMISPGVFRQDRIGICPRCQSRSANRDVNDDIGARRVNDNTGAARE